MNLNNYQGLALRTEKPLPTPLERLAHAALGFITESGEITTEVKRMSIYGKPLDAERRANIAEEIGDVLWYLAIAADVTEAGTFTHHVLSSMIPRHNRGTVESIGASALGLARAVGKFAAIVEDSLDGEPQFMGAAQHQLVWIAQALVEIAAAIDIPLADIAGANIAKLQARFPDAYSNEAAEARADKAGVDARNS